VGQREGGAGVILDLVPLPYRLAGAAVALAAAGAGLLLWGHHREQQGEAAVQARWDAERAQQQAATALALEHRRIADAQEADARKEIARESEQLQARISRDAAAVPGASAGLLQRLASADRCVARPADPAPTSGGPATSATRDLCADVLSRVLIAGGQLAATADQRGAAGIVCQSSYDALTEKGNP